LCVYVVDFSNLVLF